jgi:FAD-linked sulfhydryl oxidase
MLFEPSVWGPHYWFFLHTVAHSYPENPNEVTKRKYYDLIHNMPLFIPIAEMGNKFSNMLDKYPVTPYLDSKESFIRWVHFIHNKFNCLLGKEEFSLQNGLEMHFQK